MDCIVLRFGRFVLTEDDVLSSPGYTRQLPQRLARVLRKLVLGDGAIVSKDDLLDQCWGRDRGSEQTLAKAISDLRELLASNGANLIETVYGRGYRFRTELASTGRLTNRDRAHAVCLEASHRLHQREKGSLLAAERLYALAATAYDERSVEARVGYAEAQIRLMTAGYAQPRAAWRKARHALEEVFQIRPDCAAAHAMRALGAMSVDWDFAAAAASAAEARRLAPLAFLGNYVSARLSLSLGRTAQAVTWLRKAIDADPIETNAAELLSYALMCAGHGGAAHEAALRPMSLEPESAVSQIFYCWIEATVGDPLRACHAGAAAHRKLSESPAVAAMYAYALARKGARAESAHLLEWTQARGANEYGCDSLASICWLALGERSAALAALQRALQARCCWLPMMLRDPRNAALFGDVEFENLLLQVFGRRSKRVPPRSATVSIGPRSHSQVSGGFSESLS